MHKSHLLWQANKSEIYLCNHGWYIASLYAKSNLFLLRSQERIPGCLRLDAHSGSGPPCLACPRVFDALRPVDILAPLRLLQCNQQISHKRRLTISTFLTHRLCFIIRLMADTGTSSSSFDSVFGFGLDLVTRPARFSSIDVTFNFWLLADRGISSSSFNDTVGVMFWRMITGCQFNELVACAPTLADFFDVDATPTELLLLFAFLGGLILANLFLSFKSITAEVVGAGLRLFVAHQLPFKKACLTMCEASFSQN